MLNRVTNLTMTANAQRSLQTQQSRLADLQDKATSLNKISRPSDDPSATGQAMQTRAQLAASVQYGRNIDDGNSWLTAADSALGQATDVLHRVNDLAVQAGNGSLNQSGKNAIASELDALKEELLSIANRQHLGRNVFAGSSDVVGAFTLGSPPAFNGNAGSSVERRISPTQTVRVDADGAAIFGDGASSIFATLSSMSSDLRAGSDVSSRLAALDSGFKAVVNGRSDVGARQASLERARTVNTQLGDSLTAQQTGIEKADLSSVILDLKLQENTYQVALAATARVLQPTLMDFLR